MKIIKFDLPIDGVMVKTIDQLREHFTIEILDHYRSGLLGKWLRCRNMDECLASLTSLDGLNEHALLKGLGDVFEVEIDDLVVAAMLNEPQQTAGANVAELAKVYDDLAEAIDWGIYRAVRLNCITASTEGEIEWECAANYQRYRQQDQEYSHRDNHLKGDLLLNYSDGVYDGRFTAPGVCELISDFPDGHHALDGDILEAV